MNKIEKLKMILTYVEMEIDDCKLRMQLRTHINNNILEEKTKNTEAAEETSESETNTETFTIDNVINGLFN